MISAIIPTLNESATLRCLVDCLREMPEVAEIIVADGASQDATQALAQELGVNLVLSSRGRGVQMHQGALAARCDILWFLHADTRPAAEAPRQILEALQNVEVVGGNLAITFTGENWGSRWLTWLYPKLRRLGLCYGDSGFFVRRQVYETVGGFRPLPLFEDLDLLRRLWRAGVFAHLPARIEVSARRFEGRIFARIFARWTILQCFYWLGVSPHILVRYYPMAR